jgi:hypothetical protein
MVVRGLDPRIGQGSIAGTKPAMSHESSNASLHQMLGMSERTFGPGGTGPSSKAPRA